MNGSAPTSWNYGRRRYNYQHHYRYLGPLPGSQWDRESYHRRIPALSRLLRELHVAAGYPSSTFLADALRVTPPSVCSALNGRRMPSWQLVSNLGRLLSQLSGSDPDVVVRALYDTYTAYVPSKEGEVK